MSAKIIASLASHRLAAALGPVLMRASASAASAYQGTAEQRRACAPDVYRLCVDEIPDVRAPSPPACSGRRAI